MSKEKKKIKSIGVLTSGGDAPGMNAAIRAVVRRARGLGLKTMGVYRGYEGLMSGEIRELTGKDVSDIIGRGGTVLGSARSESMRTEDGLNHAAETCREFGIEGLIVIGGDGTFAGAQKLVEKGINAIGVPGTIDLDIACTEYTIGFDTAVNTALDAIDKVRDTTSSHERVSIIEVMGRHAGYIALWAGLGSGAEEIILPEKYDFDERRIIDNVIETRKKGKKHHIIINAEGIGQSLLMAQRIEQATGIATRATILGYMQRGGSPTAMDRMQATLMGAYAVDRLAEGATNRVVAIREGKLTDLDFHEGLAMQKEIDPYAFELSHELSYNYSKL